MGMGVAGAAYSTVLGNILSILILMTHFFSGKNTLKFRFCFSSTAIRIIKNGASSALNFVYQFITILIMNHLLANLAGTDGVVIYTVVFNLTTVSLSVFEGISQTIQPMTSTYFGEKSYKNIKETLRLAFISIIAICGSVTILMELFPQIVPMVFGIDDMVLVEKSAEAVRIYSVSMIVTTVNVVIGYYLQSTEQRVLSAVLVSLRSLVLFLIATFTLGFIFGMNGIWSAYIVSETLTLAICLVMIKVKQKKLSNVNLLLLDKETSESIECYTCKLSKDSFTEFKAELFGIINNHNLNGYITSVSLEYLSNLESFITSPKGKFVEAEINLKEQKIIIRDNLEHSNLNIDEYNLNSKSSYSPALGFNRLTLEGESNG